MPAWEGLACGDDCRLRCRSHAEHMLARGCALHLPSTSMRLSSDQPPCTDSRRGHVCMATWPVHWGSAALASRRESRAGHTHDEADDGCAPVPSELAAGSGQHLLVQGMEALAGSPSHHAQRIPQRGEGLLCTAAQGQLGRQHGVQPADQLLLLACGQSQPFGLKWGGPSICARSAKAACHGRSWRQACPCTLLGLGLEALGRESCKLQDCCMPDLGMCVSLVSLKSCPLGCGSLQVAPALTCAPCLLSMPRIDIHCPAGPCHTPGSCSLSSPAAVVPVVHPDKGAAYAVSQLAALGVGGAQIIHYRVAVLHVRPQTCTCHCLLHASQSAGHDKVPCTCDQGAAAHICSSYVCAVVLP